MASTNDDYRRGYANGAAEDRAIVLEVLDKAMEATQAAEEELGLGRDGSEGAKSTIAWVKQLPFTVRDPNDVRVDTVAVAGRKLLEETLEQIEESRVRPLHRTGGFECTACLGHGPADGSGAQRIMGVHHEPDCRYVRVSGGLKKLLGLAMLLLMTTTGCAYWPQYYYRQTPGGTAVVPANANQQPPAYQAQRAPAPRGKR